MRVESRELRVETSVLNLAPPITKKVADLFGKSAIFVYLCNRITKIVTNKMDDYPANHYNS